MTLEWNDSFSTGLIDIDAQHRALIRLTNQLSAALDAGEGEARVGELVLFLEQYVLWHFDQEEGCMHRYHCPMAAANDRAHAQFRALLLTYRERFNQEGASNQLATDLLGHLKGWMINHILRIDTSLIVCVRAAGEEIGASQTPRPGPPIDP